MSTGAETADGTLVVMVCRAKHLPNRRKLDKQLPYVLLRIGTTAKRTPSHFRAGQIPEWTHETRFQLTRDRAPIMRLDVLDETKNDPTPIGHAEIDCSVTFRNPANLSETGKYIHDEWFDLTCNDRPAGKIYLEMTFYPTAPVVPPKLGSPISGFSERLLPTPPATLTLDRAQVMDEVFEKEEKPQTRFGRLKAKFQSKEPLSNLFHHKDSVPEDDYEPLRPLELLLPPHAMPSPKQEIDDYRSSYSGRSSPLKPLRRPPPPIENIPFSADTIGLDDEPVVPKHRSPKFTGLLPSPPKHNHSINFSPPKDDIHPRFYAPSPTEELARSYRLENGNIKPSDVAVDVNTENSGYLGEGKFRGQRMLPSVFQRMYENAEKPAVPPKIPQGLTEVEYYVLEKDKYLKDINGRRL